MKGLLMYYDSTSQKNYPLVGARVTGGYSYYWREARTKEDGTFSIPEKWSYSIDYELNFDSEDFLLEDGHSVYGEDLEIEYNNTRKDWNEIFYGNKAKWCLIWSAAYQYWYGNNFGLKRPRQNTATNFSMDIEVYYKNSGDYYGFWGCNADDNSYAEYSYNWGGLEQICVLAYGRSFAGVYAGTIHEIAHTSHYWNTSKSLSDFFTLPYGFRNTYTRGVEWFFQKNRYGKSYVDYFHDYTGLIQDLIDSPNEDNGKSADGKSVLDYVSGFSLVDIENAVFKTKSLMGLKEYLKKYYPSGSGGRNYSPSDLDKLFNYWINL